MGCRGTAPYILNLTTDGCELLAPTAHWIGGWIGGLVDPTARPDMLQETRMKSILYHRLMDEHSQSVLGVVTIWKIVVTDDAQFTY
jgi:hypothetical protein